MNKKDVVLFFSGLEFGMAYINYTVGNTAVALFELFLAVVAVMVVIDLSGESR